MRKMVSVGALSILILSGLALANQSGEKDKASVPMQGMMGNMMMDEKQSEGGMGGLMKMMGQMSKMMDRCSSMMEAMESKKEVRKHE